MGVEDKVISANTNECPAGRKGLLTTIVYEDGRIKYRCNRDTDISHYKSCPEGTGKFCEVS